MWRVVGTKSLVLGSILMLVAVSSGPALSLDVGVVRTEDAKILPPDPDPDSFGWSMDADGQTLVVGEFGRRLHVYDLAHRPVSPDQSLSPADGAGLFRFSVDGETIVASSSVPWAAGSVYVFARQRHRWNEQAKLDTSNGAALETVSLSGDTVAATGGGDIHVFRRHGAMWRPDAILSASTGEDLTGVAISGKTIVGVGGGLLHFFERDARSWTAHPPLETSDGIPLAASVFSHNVAIHGQTVVVGAPGDTVGGLVAAGSAYVFSFDGSRWVEEAKLTAADPAEYVLFGRSVDVVDDQIVVGSAGFFADADDSAYVFGNSGYEWMQEAKLVRSDSPGDHSFELDYFGWSVSIADTAIAVSAMWDDQLGVDTGSVYIFER